MKHKNIFSFTFSLAVSLTLLLGACGPSGEEASFDDDVATVVALTQTATTAEAGDTPSTDALGVITGIVHLAAPPTPAMVVYALDPSTGVWASVETAAGEMSSSFRLEVPPGGYQVFASAGIGYASEDGWSLAEVNVESGVTTADINLGPPGQSICGGNFGIPASPDGQYPEIPGPTEECKTAVMSGAVEGGLQPLADDCTALDFAIETAFKLPLTHKMVFITSSSISGQTGSGCQINALGDGNDFESAQAAYKAMKNIMENDDWVESLDLPCLGHGGMGPAAAQACYFREGEICEVMTTIRPIDMELCAEIDGPIGVCLAALEPEQKVVSITVTCAQGLEGVEIPEDEPLSQQFLVEFPTDATEITLENSLQPGEIHDYIFSAFAGQEMTVNLQVTTDGVETPENAVMDIGATGYQPIARDVFGDWSGELPIKGEYFIDVKSVTDEQVTYSLTIHISPHEEDEEDDEPEEDGAISGSISYPTQTSPPLHIVAYNQETAYWYWIWVAGNSSVYSITGLPPGKYKIIAYSEKDLVGAYASVGGGSPLIITVKSGETTQGINIATWLDRNNPYFPASGDPAGW
ncbi:MAG: carboxypeptidase-like regulatory domain-containing protein [Chloroflexota bacterium]